MKVEIQLREEDLREANANAYINRAKKEQVNVKIGGLGWVVFIIVVAAIWALVSRNANRPTETQEGVYDLTPAVLPSAVAAISFLVFLSITLKMQVEVARRRAAFGKEGYERVQKTGWTGALLLIAFASLAGVQYVPAVPWRGMRFTVFLMAFVPWMLALVAVGLILWIFNRAVARSLWLRHASLQRPYTMEMDDERVVIESVNTVTIYRWSVFLRFRETENLFVLVTEDSTFIMVPKRHLPDPATMIEFRALLQTHIAEGYFLTVPAAAFPVVNAVTLPRPVIEALPRRTGM